MFNFLLLGILIVAVLQLDKFRIYLVKQLSYALTLYLTKAI